MSGARDILLWHGGLDALALARRLARAGHRVTVVAEDEHEAVRLRDHLRGLPGVTVSLGKGGGADWVIGAGDLPEAPVRLRLGAAGAGPAVLFHDAAVEIDWGGLPSGRMAEVTAGLTAAGFAVLAVPAGAKAFPGAVLLAQVRALSEALLLDGATPWEIDEAMLGLGHGIGLLAAEDRRGLTIEPARPALIRDRMVREGRLGRAVGVGWYRYPGGGGAVVDPLLEDLIAEEAHFAGLDRRERSLAEVSAGLVAGLAGIRDGMVSAGVLSGPDAFAPLLAAVLGPAG